MKNHVRVRSPVHRHGCCAAIQWGVGCTSAVQMVESNVIPCGRSYYCTYSSIVTISCSSATKLSTVTFINNTIINDCLMQGAVSTMVVPTFTPVLLD